jgi:hypothetical protein
LLKRTKSSPFEQFSTTKFAQMTSLGYLCSRFQLIDDLNLMLTMITSFGVKPGKYSGRVQAQLTLDDLFH